MRVSKLVISLSTIDIIYALSKFYDLDEKKLKTSSLSLCCLVEFTPEAMLNFSNMLLGKDLRTPPDAKYAPFRTAINTVSPWNFSKIFF